MTISIGNLSEKQFLRAIEKYDDARHHEQRYCREVFWPVNECENGLTNDVMHVEHVHDLLASEAFEQAFAVATTPAPTRLALAEKMRVIGAAELGQATECNAVMVSLLADVTRLHGEG